MEAVVERATAVSDVDSQYRARITSDPSEIVEVRKQIEALAKAHGFTEPAVGEIGLSVNEALANVMRHAYSGVAGRPIEVLASMEGSELQIEIRDWGSGVVPELKCEKPAHELLTPGGLGLACMLKIMDKLKFIRQPDGMLLKMSKSKR